MNSFEINLPRISRAQLEMATPALAVAAIYGFALLLPSVGHRLVPLPVLAVHAGTALSALVLGAVVLFRRKGNATHRMLGKVWVALMMIVSLTAFGIQTQGHLSMIHLLAVVTPVYLIVGIYHAKRGNIASHLRAMRGVYIGLVIAAIFALATPGRALTHLVFGA